MFKKRNARAESGTRPLREGTKGPIRGTTAPETPRGGGIRPGDLVFFAKSGHLRAAPRDNDGAMRPRLLFAAPVLLVVWLASDHAGPRAGDAASTTARYDPSETPTSQPDFGRAASAAGAVNPSDPTRTPTAPPETALQAAGDSVFAATVRPILVSHCAPCHEPGGKMYERLPFDCAETITSHSAGVLRRIKVPDEKAAIEKWLASK
jgi:hypothetical protein